MTFAKNRGSLVDLIIRRFAEPSSATSLSIKDEYLNGKLMQDQLDDSSKLAMLNSMLPEMIDAFVNEASVANGLTVTQGFKDDITKVLKELALELKDFTWYTGFPTLQGTLANQSVAGTPDLIAEKDGEYYIIDFKTSAQSRRLNKALYDRDDQIQQNAYADLFEQNTGKKLNRIFILNLIVNGDQKTNTLTGVSLDRFDNEKEKNTVFIEIPRTSVDELKGIAPKEPVAAPVSNVERNPVIGDTLTSDSNQNYKIRGTTDKGGVQWENTKDGSKGVWSKEKFDEYIKNGRLKYDTAAPVSDKKANNTISNGDKIISVQTKPVTNEITDTAKDLFILPDKNPEGRIHINMAPLKDILVVPNNTLTVIDKKTGKEVVNKELNPEGAVIFEAMQGRLFVVANINGQLVPFYKSSAGTSGKTQGAWYPFFGYTGAWLVKGGIDKATGKMSYSPEIDRVTDLLNENLVFPDKYIDRTSNSIKNTKGEVIIDMNQSFKVNRLWQKEFGSQTGIGTNYQIKGLKENTRSESGLVALITGLNTTELDSSKTPKENSEWFNLISKNTELAALEGKPTTPEVDWNAVIDRATSVQEVDKIMDQIYAANASTPELLDKALVKKQSFKPAKAKVPSRFTGKIIWAPAGTVDPKIFESYDIVNADDVLKETMVDMGFMKADDDYQEATLRLSKSTQKDKINGEVLRKLKELKNQGKTIIAQNYFLEKQADIVSRPSKDKAFNKDLYSNVIGRTSFSQQEYDKSQEEGWETRMNNVETATNLSVKELLEKDTKMSQPVQNIMQASDIYALRAIAKQYAASDEDRPKYFFRVDKENNRVTLSPDELYSILEKRGNQLVKRGINGANDLKTVLMEIENILKPSEPTGTEQTAEQKAELNNAVQTGTDTSDIADEAINLDSEAESKSQKEIDDEFTGSIGCE